LILPCFKINSFQCNVTDMYGFVDVSGYWYVQGIWDSLNE
jgi:hypothetical protein